jgi:hypothetical protein
MDWFIVVVVVLFFTVAILTSDYWLDKIFGVEPIDQWDETDRWNDMRQALENERRHDARPAAGSVVDFRRPRNWDDETP